MPNLASSINIDGGVVECPEATVLDAPVVPAGPVANAALEPAISLEPAASKALLAVRLFFCLLTGLCVEQMSLQVIKLRPIQDPTG
mmetsp:Transcript_7757/g.13026  ORF Transcript_7757/g.13026 Transcript_7757/m.13026 type:complete len:86 (-) Transcript_7757:25-282(-)